MAAQQDGQPEAIFISNAYIAQHLSAEAQQQLDVFAKNLAKEQDNPEPSSSPRQCSIWELIIGPEATHWSRLLVQDHLSCADRLHLSGTCTAARGMVLVTAQHLTIQVDLSKQGSSRSRPQAAKRAMAVRGNLPTKLQLRASNPGQLSRALGALQPGSERLGELHVWCDATLPRILLATIGQRWRHLRVLGIHAAIHELPDRLLFPQLQRLSIQLPMGHSGLEAIFRTAGPYVKQLTHLSFPSFGHPRIPVLALLLSPGSSTLRTLHLNVPLDDTLLGLMLQCAPTLEVLTVHGIRLQSATHAHVHTRWRRLQLSGPAGTISLSSLPRLPLAPGLELHVTDTTWLTCDITTSSAEEAVVARLRDVRFTACIDDREIYLDILCDLGEVEQLAALRIALRLMRSWSWDNERPNLFLLGWTLTDELLRELSGLPQWEQVDMSAATWLPEPQSYAPLLSLLPSSYRTVTISAEQLSTEQVEGVCLGAPLTRAPLCIELCDCDPDLPDLIQHKMQQLGSFSHVTVLGTW